MQLAWAFDLRYLLSMVCYRKEGNLTITRRIGSMQEFQFDVAAMYGVSVAASGRTAARHQTFTKANASGHVVQWGPAEASTLATSKRVKPAGVGGGGVVNTTQQSPHAAATKRTRVPYANEATQCIGRPLHESMSTKPRWTTDRGAH